MPIRSTRGATWQRLAQRLREDIETGRFKAGEMLPAEAELARRTGTSRTTLRLALRELAQQGLIRLQQGQALVQGPIIDFTLAQDGSLIHVPDEPGRGAGCTVLATELERASASQLQTLGLTPAALIARLELAITVAGQTAAYVVHRCPATRLPGVIELVRKTPSLAAAIRALGHAETSCAWVRLSAILPPPRVAKLLDRLSDQPVLRAEWLIQSALAQPLDLAECYLAGDASRLRIEGASGSPKKPARRRPV